MLRIAIVQFPGSNCERETAMAVKRAQMMPVDFLWNEPRDKLRNVDGYVIPGGFSYEDRSRAGIIAALDPVMETIKAESEKGKPILGICNGAQILIESGLVPGLENHRLGMALAENKRMRQGEILGTGYYNAWVCLRLSRHYQRNMFTLHLSETEVLSMPVAHAEGRFMMTHALWQEIEAQGLAIFQYCDEAGNLIPHFPINPNGSMHNIAAIANKQGNVMAMMPHPERSLVGDKIFASMRDSLAQSQAYHSLTPLFYYPRPLKIEKYVKPVEASTFIITSLITDNHAMTVENTLNQQGIKVKIKRYQHYEITLQDDKQALMDEVIQSGVIFNERKEAIQQEEALLTEKNSQIFLIRDKENIKGQEVQQTLTHHFNLPAIISLKHGILWQFTSEDVKIEDLIHSILQTNIIANPYAHDCYQYA